MDDLPLRATVLGLLALVSWVTWHRRGRQGFWDLLMAVLTSLYASLALALLVFELVH